jgi:hypothetical protein
VIPKEDLVRLSRQPDAAQELVGSGWWKETANAYVIRHHATYQRKKEAVLHQQQVNKANAEKGGRPPKTSREVFKPREETGSQTESLTETETEGDRTGQALAYKGGSSSEQQIDWITGEVFPSSGCSACGDELTSAMQQQRGVCNRCWVAADAERRTAVS